MAPAACDIVKVCFRLKRHCSGSGMQSIAPSSMRSIVQPGNIFQNDNIVRTSFIGVSTRRRVLGKLCNYEHCRVWILWSMFIE